jgi:hypothetical protein
MQSYCKPLPGCTRNGKIVDRRPISTGFNQGFSLRPQCHHVCSFIPVGSKIHYTLLDTSFLLSWAIFNVFKWVATTFYKVI